MYGEISVQGLSKADIIRLKEAIPPADIQVKGDNYLEYSQNDIPLTEIILAATPLVLGILALILRPKSTSRGKISITSYKKSKDGAEEKKDFLFEYDDKHLKSNEKELQELTKFVNGESV